MQISDLVKQYHQAISSGAEKLTGTKGVENLVASLRSLTKGNIFEGTFTSVKNGRVSLSLSGGQQVMARLDGKISLMEEMCIRDRAYAAKCYGCKAVIVMPTTTPLIKVNRTKSYGAEVRCV